MLPTKKRLRGEAEYKIIYRQGGRKKTDFLDLIFLKNQFKFSRHGIVVANSISKKATTRNLLKRRIRHYLKQLESSTQQGFDYVWVTKPGVLSLKVNELRQQIEQLLVKIR